MFFPEVLYLATISTHVYLNHAAIEPVFCFTLTTVSIFFRCLLHCDSQHGTYVTPMLDLTLHACVPVPDLPCVNFPPRVLRILKICYSFLAFAPQLNDRWIVLLKHALVILYSSLRPSLFWFA